MTHSLHPADQCYLLNLPDELIVLVTKCLNQHDTFQLICCCRKLHSKFHKALYSSVVLSNYREHNHNPRPRQAVLFLGTIMKSSILAECVTAIRFKYRSQEWNEDLAECEYADSDARKILPLLPRLRDLDIASPWGESFFDQNPNTPNDGYDSPNTPYLISRFLKDSVRNFIDGGPLSSLRSCTLYYPMELDNPDHCASSQSWGFLEKSHFFLHPNLESLTVKHGSRTHDVWKSVKNCAFAKSVTKHFTNLRRLELLHCDLDMEHILTALTLPRALEAFTYSRFFAEHRNGQDYDVEHHPSEVPALLNGLMWYIPSLTKLTLRNLGCRTMDRADAEMSPLFEEVPASLACFQNLTYLNIDFEMLFSPESDVAVATRLPQGLQYLTILRRFTILGIPNSTDRMVQASTCEFGKLEMLKKLILEDEELLVNGDPKRSKAEIKFRDAEMPSFGNYFSNFHFSFEHIVRRTWDWRRYTENRFF